MTLHQLENPNNARINIDYSKEKAEVKFDYVGTSSYYTIVKNFFLKVWYYRGLCILGIIPTFFLCLNLIPINTIQKQITWIVLASLYLIVPPYFLAFILSKNKRFIKILPKLQYFFSKNFYYCEFKSDAVNDNKIEIPLYANIGLDYQAYDDFSRYLLKVDIIEHPFMMYVKNKKKRNEYLWKCTFYFSQKPKNGILKVRFK
ncbi:MAG TPA: hypothetical protein VIR31_05945 [Nitrososphaeraceae archaeon]